MILKEKGDLACKAKAHLEFYLSRDVKSKSNEKCFCRSIIHKRETTENVSPLLHGSGHLMTGNTEHAEMFNIFSILFFLLTFRSQVHGTVWITEDWSSIEGD